jgi:hypothetical protein
MLWVSIISFFALGWLVAGWGRFRSGRAGRMTKNNECVPDLPWLVAGAFSFALRIQELDDARIGSFISAVGIACNPKAKRRNLAPVHVGYFSWSSAG